MIEISNISVDRTDDLGKKYSVTLASEDHSELLSLLQREASSETRFIELFVNFLHKEFRE